MEPTPISEDTSSEGERAADVAGPDAAELTSTDLAMLAMENQRWKYPGAKDTAILERFGVSATRYYQLLDSLIDKPAALAADPLLVNRLRRLRQRRATQRSAQR